MSRRFWSIAALGIVVATAVGISGCGGGGTSATPPVAPPTGGSTLALERKVIKHVVIIIQENRSFDNMFNGYPGADTVQQGTIHTGQVVPLEQITLAAGYNLSHKGRDFFTSYDKGKLDGFDLVAAGNVGNAHGYILVPPYPQYAYVPPSDNRPYWDMASQYALSDRTFQSNIDASFVAHQYLIRGNASSAVDNPPGTPWGCDAQPGALVSTLLANQKYGPGIVPCFDATTVADELEAKHLTWHFYSPQVRPWNYGGHIEYGEVWSAMGAISHIRKSSRWGTNVTWPETSILRDVPNGKLADVTWVTPAVANSDHPSSFSLTGPSWVSSIVNTIGQSKFWNSTAIIVLWDDAGNWYDHVPPPQLDYDGLGFRVPFMVISPYARQGVVLHEQWESVSSIKFVENLFGLAPIAAADTRAMDITDAFDFTQSPRPFQFINTYTPWNAQWFLTHDSAEYDPPDDL